jgi:hypothetical protein
MLFQSSDEDVQAFAADALRSAEGLSGFTAEEWIGLLRSESPLALTIICELAAQHLPPASLSLEQCIELACQRPAPVAELGLRFAQTKSIRGEASVRAVAGLGRAEDPRARQEGVQWAVQVIERSPYSKPEHLRDMIDSPHEDARRLAVAVMTRSLRFKDATELWAALAESPYDDTQAFSLLHLTRRKSAFSPDTLRHLWAGALLAVHRGSLKRTVMDRIADHMALHPAEAESVLPLFGIALRRVREPERQAAVAALTRAVVRDPSLRQAITKILPELKLEGEVSP